MLNKIEVHIKASAYLSGYFSGLNGESPIISLWTDGIGIREYVAGYINGICFRLGVYKIPER